MAIIYKCVCIQYNIESVKMKVAQLCPTLCNPMDFSRSEYWSGQPFPSPGELPNPGIKPRSHTLQADSLPAEPQGKPKNTGVGSLSLLQQIFQTQKLNQGLLHCRQILYQLSHQGSLGWVAEPPGSTGMGSLSLLQQIFQTQKSNQGLLHCRRILYQLSYQGSPVQCRLSDTQAVLKILDLSSISITCICKRDKFLGSTTDLLNQNLWSRARGGGKEGHSYQVILMHIKV